MTADQLKQFGTRYTAAWCSQDAARVAAIPDMVVAMDEVVPLGDVAVQERTGSSQ